MLMFNHVNNIAVRKLDKINIPKFVRWLFIIDLNNIHVFTEYMSFNPLHNGLECKEQGQPEKYY